MSGMMMARAATNDIFSDLHITPQSIEQLKVREAEALMLVIEPLSGTMGSEYGHPVRIPWSI